MSVQYTITISSISSLYVLAPLGCPWRQESTFIDSESVTPWRCPPPPCQIRCSFKNLQGPRWIMHHLPVELIRINSLWYSNFINEGFNCKLGKAMTDSSPVFQSNAVIQADYFDVLIRNIVIWGFSSRAQQTPAVSYYAMFPSDKFPISIHSSIKSL